MGDGAEQTLDVAGVPLATFAFETAGRAWTIRAARDHDALLSVSDRFSQFPFGMLLWESAPALAHWIAERPQALQGCRVLELGAGAGLAGLVARHLGADVVQTDHSPEALALCRLNAALNGIEGMSWVLADWTRWELSERFDVILGADVLYDRTSHDAVMNILETNLCPGGAAILTDPMRQDTPEFVERMRRAGWIIEMSNVEIAQALSKVDDRTVPVSVIVLRNQGR